ncbi:RipA family octameric membrane protein [Dermabacteraceae bacterium P13088]
MLLGHKETIYVGASKRDLEESLKVALAERRFEIEQYWKRNTYFLVIIGAIATAYVALLNSSGYSVLVGYSPPPLRVSFAMPADGANSGIKEAIVNLALPLLGFAFSLGWSLVSLGSKYWQENWEMQVNLLEKRLGRRVHWAVLETDPSECKYLKKRSSDSCVEKRLFASRAFSVSKVNQALSYILTSVWFLLLSASSYSFFKDWMGCFAQVASLAFIAFLVFLWLPASKMLRSSLKESPKICRNILRDGRCSCEQKSDGK